MCCKGQLGDHLIAIWFRSKKTLKNFNFFQKIKEILEIFTKKMKKFWNFSKSKNQKNLKIFFSAQNLFFIHPGSKLGHFEHFLGQKSQFKNYHFFNLEKIWKSGVPLRIIFHGMVLCKIKFLGVFCPLLWKEVDQTK